MLSHQRTLVALGLSAALAWGHAPAQELTLALADDADRAELEKLLTVIEEQTEIATKTRLNADYVPGLVTVLTGEELEARGAHTVWDALAFVPGIEPTFDRLGNRLVTIRGVGGAMGSGNIKILLNDMAMNGALSALADPVLQMPVEQVKRIEVIRGPGSAIHGEFAYAGVVNVVTRKEGREVYAKTGSHDRIGAGGLLSWNDAGRDLRFSANVSAWKRSDTDTRTGPDAAYGFYDSQADVSFAPGPVNDEMDHLSAIFDLQWKDLTLRAQYLDENKGDYFGATSILPDPDWGKAQGSKFLTVEAEQHLAFSPTLSADVRLGWLRHESELHQMATPPGFDYWYATEEDFTELFMSYYYGLPLSDDPDRVMPDGYLFDGRYSEQRLSAGGELSWTGMQGHAWLLGASFSEVSVGEAWQDLNIDPMTLEILPEMRRFRAETGADWPSEDTVRRIRSLLVQDEIALGEDVTVTAGARYDHYSDVGDNLSPRLAAVWKLDRQNVIKAQYAEAFRPPTFFELSWSPELDPETTRTFELGYVNRRPTGVARVTLFHTRMDDLIVQNFADNTIGYANSEEARTRGVELELEQRIAATWKLDASVSYADTEDERTGEAIPGSAELISTAALSWQPQSTRMYVAQVRYVGPRQREVIDPRDELESVTTLDLSANLYKFSTDGLTLRFGVNDVFDEGKRQPAEMLMDNYLNIIDPTTVHAFPSYPDDYPTPGRTWWLQMAYKF